MGPSEAQSNFIWSFQILNPKVVSFSSGRSKFYINNKGYSDYQKNILNTIIKLEYTISNTI